MLPTSTAARWRAVLRHPLILPLYLPSILFSIAGGLLAPVLPLYVQEFNAPLFWVGLVLAGDGLGLLISDLPAGVLLQRLDRRRGMALGVAVMGLAVLALTWASSIPEAFLYRVIAGAGSALYNVSRSAYVSESITIASRGRGVALLGGTFRMGRTIGPVLAGWLALAAGLRAPFVLFAAVCALAILALLAAPAAPQAPAPVRRALRLDGLLNLLRHRAREFAAPGLGCFLMMMIRNGSNIMIPLFASEVLSLNVQQIGWILSLGSAIDMTLFYPTGIIMDRLGRKWAIIPSAVLMALGMALIPFTTTFLQMALAVMLNGFGNGLGSGVMITLGADLAPPEARSEFLGLWLLIGDAGVTSSPILIGAVADALAMSPAVWAVAATGFAAALVFGVFVPETLQKPRVEAA